MAEMVKHLPTTRETQVQSLGEEELLEKEMATHSSILSQEISWTEEPGWLQSIVLPRFRHDWAHPQCQFGSQNAGNMTFTFGYEIGRLFLRNLIGL